LAAGQKQHERESSYDALHRSNETQDQLPLARARVAAMVECGSHVERELRAASG
jgi:hypothetical protein